MAIKKIELSKKGGLICRGISGELKVNLKLAQKVLDGTLTAEEALKSIKQPVGRWWYLIGHDNATIEDSKEFAQGEDDLTQGFGAFMTTELMSGDEKQAEVEFPIVLVAEQPDNWSPDDNEDNGLMGNSFIAKHKTVTLIQVHYLSSKGWVTKPLRKEIRI